MLLDIPWHRQVCDLRKPSEHRTKDDKEAESCQLQYFCNYASYGMTHRNKLPDAKLQNAKGGYFPTGRVRVKNEISFGLSDSSSQNWRINLHRIWLAVFKNGQTLAPDEKKKRHSELKFEV